MKKYLRVARNTWEEILTYRFNFLMWRIRTVVVLLSIYYLWHALIPPGQSVFGYDQSSILTYILGTAIVAAVVLSNRSNAIGDEINEGNLSNYLLKPINYFLYWLWKDIGDKAMNILLSIVEMSVIVLILHPPIFIQNDIQTLFLFLISLGLAIILHYLMNLLLGFIGFWSPDVWAPRFIFWVALGFFAGSYFPLDILPEPFFTIFNSLPFSYLIYFPIKIYLGQLSLTQILNGFLIVTIWIGLLMLFVNFVWARGLKVYTSQGR